jgi:hypothetical protein
MESDVNPIDPAQRLQDAPRCTATALSPPDRAARPQRSTGGVCAVFMGLVEVRPEAKPIRTIATGDEREKSRQSGG